MWPILARIAELWDRPDDGEKVSADTQPSGTAPAPVPENPPVASPVAEPAPVAEAEAPRAIRSFQADALLAGVLGADVDLGQYGEADSKGIVASIVGAAPTVASLNRKGVAAE